jgi:hypothetical protein
MSGMKILWAHLERNPLHQVAAFSMAGLALSLAFGCDLQIPAQWL